MPNKDQSKAILLDLASNGSRIDVNGRTLFAGFKLNQNWEGRREILSRRLDGLAIPGARFSILRSKGPELTAGWEQSGEVVVE